MVNSISNNLSILRNAQNSFKSEVILRHSKMMHEVVKVLRSEGYIRGFSLNSKQITVYLKYLNNRSTSNNMLLISKPSRRIFYTYNDILKKASSRGALILSTSKGVLSSTDALGFRVGGEVLFFIN